MPIEHLIFAGGGTRGLAYAAVLDELVRAGRLEYARLKSVAGTSIGALFCVLVAIRLPPSKMLEMIHTNNIDDLLNIDMSNLFYRWGLDDGKKLYQFVDNILREQTGVANLTFQQLYDRFPIDLYIPVTNLNTAEKIIVNRGTFPDMPVAYGVQMSMSLPPFFAPVFYNHAYYVDGGLMSNFFVDHISDPSNMLGIRITWDNAFHLNSIEQYCSRIVYVALYNNEQSQWKTLPPAYQDHVLKVPGGDVATINFRLASSTINCLLTTAREHTKQFCQANAWTNPEEAAATLSQNSRDCGTQTSAAWTE
jgi:predicted acylesterase/phospholipase RssA